MALIKCIECGKEFSDKAQACPNCACPVSEMVVQKEVVIEDGVKVSTKQAFEEYAKEQFDKIPQYRAKVREVTEEFAPESAEYEEISEKMKALEKKRTVAFNRFNEAEEAYTQSCKGLFGASSKKAKEAKAKMDELKAVYEECELGGEYDSLKERKEELSNILYSMSGPKMKKLKALRKEYPFCNNGYISLKERDATFEEFLKASRKEYIHDEIIEYVVKNGALEIETYARLTEFDLYEVLHIAEDEARKYKYSYHMEKVQGKNVLVKGPKPDDGSTISTSSINYNAAIAAFSPKAKKASVLGRAALGAAIAGPTGAVIGALSAIDKNNSKK